MTLVVAPARRSGKATEKTEAAESVKEPFVLRPDVRSDFFSRKGANRGWWPRALRIYPLKTGGYGKPLYLTVLRFETYFSSR
jgi:hypothetical protein